MPSFDVVCEVDLDEVRNAVDQANREIGTRFDFKGSDSRVELSEYLVTIHAEDDFKASQILDILNNKLVKRKVDLEFLDPGPVKPAAGDRVTQQIRLHNGIEQDLAKKLVKILKAGKIKVQAAVQGDQLRVSGKKRDDLQQAIQLLRDSDSDRPLQYVNFRD
jgi:cyclic-di-GMP-binding protein